MKKLIINGWAWYYDPETEILYENEDKTGISYHRNYKHWTISEINQIEDQIKFDNPMIKYP